MMPANCLRLRSSAACRCASAGNRHPAISAAAAICIAVGKQSFDDWLILTWSLGCTGALAPGLPPSISLARAAITSFTFMLVWVPDPVCHTTRGKWSSSLPSITSWAARTIARVRRGARGTRLDPDGLGAIGKGWIPAFAVMSGVGLLRVHRHGRIPPVRQVQSAFLFLFLFPPPPAGALRLARRQRTRAGSAADGKKTAIMQAVVGDPVIAHEVRHPIARPIQERVELEQATLRIDRGKAHHRPLCRLLGAHPRHPCAGALEGARERFDLAQPAAPQPRLDRGAETVDAVLGNPCFDATALGEESLDAPSIVLLGLRPDLVRLREQAAGVEGHDLDAEVLGENSVADRLVLETRAGGEDEAARDCGAGGREPLVKAEAGAGTRKPLPDRSERMRLPCGLVRQVLLERLVVHEHCEPCRHPE